MASASIALCKVMIRNTIEQKASDVMSHQEILVDYCMWTHAPANAKEKRF